MAPACALALALSCPLAAASEPDTPAPPRTLVAVSGFEMDAGCDSRDAWMAVALEETLTWRLKRVQGIVAIPTVRLHQAARELGDAQEADRSSLNVARLLGAHFLLKGTVRGTPDRVSLRLALRNAREREAPPRETELAADRLFEALDEATRWVLAQLQPGPLDERVQRVIFGPPARSPSALEYHAKALDAVRAERLREAAYFASEAVSYDLRYRPALLLLAQLELRGDWNSRMMAIRRLRALAELARWTGDLLDRAEIELTHGLVLDLSETEDAGLTRFENALALAHEAGDVYGQLGAMNAICDHYLSRRAPASVPLTPQQTGRYVSSNLREAARWQQLVLDELTSLGDVIAQVPTTNKLALIHERLGDLAGAIEMHKQTLAAAQRSAAKRVEATAWMFLGQCYRRQERWLDAIDALDRCLELANERTRPAVHMARGEVRAAMGDDQAADALLEFENAQRQLRDGSDLMNQLLCLRRIGDLRRQLGRKPEALAALDEAIDLAHALEVAEEQDLRALREQWQREQ
jgi:tetratricopeptide (TPR) repeat protein